MAQRRNFKPIVAPSVLSANFANLEKDIRTLEMAGLDWLHLDVMDGHYVPNITFGPIVVEAIRSITPAYLDCHLMVSEPERWIEPFVKAGANSITVHVESTSHLDRLLQQIKDLGCKAGVSLNPATPLVSIEEVIHLVDLVLLMSVNPGFGGQKFIESTLTKVKRLADARDQLPFLIEVDGGINPSNIERLRKAGADVFVAGSAIFDAHDQKKAFVELKMKVESIKI